MCVPVSVFDIYPQSRAEQYIAIRSRMLYDANALQPDTDYNVSIDKEQENLQRPSVNVSILNQLTDNNTLETPHSRTKPPTFCTQKSLDQLMQTWYEDEVKKIQEKRLFGYIYGLRPQPATEDKVSNATILTPSRNSE
jgi:hypothetical protein